MKQIKLTLIAVAAICSVQTTKAQTVDEVVNKHVMAMGGKEKLSTLKSVRMDGMLNASGTDVNLTITKSQLIGERIDINAMGMNGYQLFTPTSGTVYMPFLGQTAPEVMKEEQVKTGAAGLDIQGALLNYKEKGNDVQLAGKEKVDSFDCYKIKATLKSGLSINYFIDTKTNYIVKTVATQTVGGGQKEEINGYGNYKATDAGFIFPFTTTIEQGEINFSKIETNVAVDEKIFTDK